MKKFLLISMQLLLMLSCKKEEATKAYQLPAEPYSRLYTADEIKAFKELTVKSIYNNGTLIKLVDSVVGVYVSDTSYTYMNVELDSIISQINTLTEGIVTLKKTTDKSTAVINLYLTSRAEYLLYEPRAAGSFASSPYELDGLCYRDWNAQGEMFRANVLVDMVRINNDAAAGKYLLRHELTHALGLGHLDLINYMGSVMFYFRATTPPHAYDPIDKKMIQLLYNPQMKAGMDESAINTVLVNL